MERRNFLATLAAGAATPAFSAFSAPGAGIATPPGLKEKLEEIRLKHKIPSLGATRFGVDGVLYQEVTGFRKAGGTKPVTVQDLWHLGSMTKAMTASLLATYVDGGKLHWEDTLGDLIPKACKDTHPDAKKITVLQLLHHRSGLPANLPNWWILPGADQRGELLRLAAPAGGKFPTPDPAPFLYSNIGYALAGHIAEVLGNKSWESLIQDRLFKPLKINAGQGPAGKEGKDDQPWPHDEKGQPFPTNGPPSDNPPSLGPAGRVHASMENYARFAADHLRGAKNLPALLKPESYQTLHHPSPDSGYACGWATAERPWAGGNCLTHNGTNNANYFVAWLAPEKAFGVLAATNQGGPAGAAATDAACSLLISLAG